MRTILALTATSLIAIAAPAFAQSAGAPGAVGVGGPLTGSNPGTGYYNYSPGYDPYAYGDGYYGPQFGYVYEGGYGPAPAYYGYPEYGYGPRAWRRPRTPSEEAANPTPETVRGDMYNNY